MSNEQNAEQRDFEEIDWWESVPDLKLVDDINPQVFSLVESALEEEPEPEEDTHVVDKIEEKLASTAQHIEQAVEQKVKPDNPLPKRITWGAGERIRDLGIVLAVAAVGSVFLTWVSNYATNPDYTVGDAANFLVSAIAATFKMIAGFFGLA